MVEEKTTNVWGKSMNVHARRILGSGLLAICLSLSFVEVQADTLIGSSSRGSSPASIYSIDTDTGVATLIGPIGLIDTEGSPNKVSAIALDPISGVYYAIWGSSCTGARLITIDLVTGTGTVIGVLKGAGFDATSVLLPAPCPGGSDALIFTDDGRLYAEGWNAGFVAGNLLEIDKSGGTVLSAVATTLGLFGFPSGIAGIGMGTINGISRARASSATS